MDQSIGVERRLDKIEESLRCLLKEKVIKSSYSTTDVAKILGKAEFTVREWCRQRRVRAEKRQCGRGNSKEWMISHSELERIQAEGLLPLKNGSQGIALYRREKMAISFSHFLGLMSAPGVDHPLIDAFACAIRYERMPKDMPSTNFLPAATRKRLIKIIGCFVHRKHPAIDGKSELGFSRFEPGMHRGG